jgi:hypothetical protein
MIHGNTVRIQEKRAPFDPSIASGNWRRFPFQFEYLKALCADPGR